MLGPISVGPNVAPERNFCGSLSDGSSRNKRISVIHMGARGIIARHARGTCSGLSHCTVCKSFQIKFLEKKKNLLGLMTYTGISWKKIEFKQGCEKRQRGLWRKCHTTYSYNASAAIITNWHVLLVKYIVTLIVRSSLSLALDLLKVHHISGVKSL